MRQRWLGQRFQVSAIGIGCMPMIAGGNISYGQADEGESIATIHEAIDLGVTFFDTAEMYGPFTNEALVGRAIRGRRQGLQIATKFAMKWNGDQMAGLDGSPANARRAVEGSLQRLGIDEIDLFYQHRVDPNVPIEETVGGMADLQREGKIRHIGLSEAGPETLRRAAATAPIAALQSEYRCGSAASRTRSSISAARTISASSPIRRSGATSSRAASGRWTISRPTTGGATIRAIRRRTCPRIWPSSTRWRRSPRRTASRTRRSRWPGCSRRATSSRRSRA